MAARAAAATNYAGLHKYLHDRFAQTVVLTFAEIEDLLGFALPDAARKDRGWWLDPGAGGAPQPQSLSWSEANRTAVPNLLARIVTFERLPEPR
jgi:hypothetical protein